MKALFFTLVFLLLVQCSSKKKSSEPFSDVGLWAGKVLMTNKTTNHKKWVNVTWASDSENDRMRIDITAILDVPVATYIKNNKGYHLWLFTDRKYFFSQDGEKLFQHLTKLSLDPSIFYSLLGEPQPPSSEWACKNKDSILSCSSAVNKTRFLVKHEEADERTIRIEKGVKALKIKLSKSKVQLQDELFKSLSTSQFKTVKI